MEETITRDGLTDLHNRRDNIALVAKYFAEHDYPFLAWPEDKQLLRLTDLPIFIGRNGGRVEPRQNKHWPIFKKTSSFLVPQGQLGDDRLQQIIEVGALYAVTDIFKVGNFPTFEITVYRFTTMADVACIDTWIQKTFLGHTGFRALSLKDYCEVEEKSRSYARKFDVNTFLAQWLIWDFARGESNNHDIFPGNHKQSIAA
jgi:hypothetical protein